MAGPHEASHSRASTASKLTTATVGMLCRPRSSSRAFLLLLAAAAAIRAAAWTRTAVLFNDGPVFLSMAEAILDGRWDAVLAHPYHPLYPLCIALLGLLPLELETAAVAVSIAGGLLGVAALHVFVRDHFGRRAGWIAGWLAALHPSAVDFSSDVMSDGLYSGLWLAGLAVLARTVRDPSSASAITAGALAGLAYWVRPEGLGLLVAGGVALCWRAAREPGERRRALSATAWLILMGSLLAAPYMVGLEMTTGELALTQKKSVRALALGEAEGGEAPTPGRGSTAAPERSEAVPEGPAEGSPRAVGMRPIALPEHSVRADGPGAQRPPRSLLGWLDASQRVLRTGLSALRYELAALVLLGIFLLRRSGGERWPRWPARLLGITTLLYGALLVLLVWGAGYVSRRHALPFLLPWLGFGSLAIGWALRAGRGPEREPLGWLGRRRAGRWLPIVFALLLAGGWLARDLRPRRVERIAVREAAEWLAARHPASGGVAAQKLRAAYYAGAPFVPLPPGRDGRLEARLRSRGAQWVVIDEAKLGDHIGLADGIGSWLTPVHRAEAAGRVAVVLAIASRPAQ